jgi:hypothetical protein
MSFEEKFKPGEDGLFDEIKPGDILKSTTSTTCWKVLGKTHNNLAVELHSLDNEILKGEDRKKHNFQRFLIDYECYEIA